VSLDGQEVLVVQAKASRLGMNLMGQAIISADLLRARFRPASVRGVALCTADDAVLGPLLAARGVEVVVLPALGTTARRGAT
jgi:hypothetical protein